MRQLIAAWLALLVCACAPDQAPTTTAPKTPQLSGAASSDVPSREPPHVASLSDLPIDVRQFVLSLCDPCEFADADGPWNMTDVMDDRPTRRLTGIERRGRSWRIEYDHGGIGPHAHVLMIATAPNVHLADGSSCIASKTVSCEW